MINLAMEPRPPSSTATAERALSFISKGWSSVRDSADADLQLMRARASSFKSLADRELENFLTSASSSLAVPSSDAALAEFEFVKRIQPKLTAIRRAYSSPDFSRKVLEKWAPGTRIGLDLSGIRNAFVSEVDDARGVMEEEVRVPRRRVRWKGQVEEREWEPIRQLRRRLKELERRSQSSEMFSGFRSSEFVEKVKLSLGHCSCLWWSRRHPPKEQCACGAIGECSVHVVPERRQTTREEVSGQTWGGAWNPGHGGAMTQKTGRQGWRSECLANPSHLNIKIVFFCSSLYTPTAEVIYSWAPTLIPIITTMHIFLYDLVEKTIVHFFCSIWSFSLKVSHVIQWMY